VHLLVSQLRKWEFYLTVEISSNKRSHCYKKKLWT